MQHTTQVSLIKRIFELAERRTTTMHDTFSLNPVEAYTDAARQALETERLFRSRPLVITASCRLKNPGDYLADELSGVPILLVRDEQGRLNAFANVCRHRGAALATGCGTGATSFRCPYHAWTYDLQGRLRALSPQDAFAGLERVQRGLIRLPVVERHGLVWVSPHPEAQIDGNPLPAALDAELASYGFADLSHFETRVLRKRMNWKLAIDTFLENGHLDKVHRNTIAPIFLPGIGGLVDSFGPHLRLVAPRRSILSLRDEPEERWNLLKHALVIYLLFPNVLVNWQADHLETWRAFPVPGLGPGHCQVEASLYTPRPATRSHARAYWDRNMELLMRTVEDEDFPIAEGIQRGFEADLDQFITFGRHEPGLTQYHAALNAALGQAHARTRGRVSHGKVTSTKNGSGRS